MNTLVIGSGAIGTLFYQGLYQQSAASTFLHTRTPIDCLSFSNFSGYSKQIPVKTLLDYQSAELVLLCLKSYQVKNCLEELQSTLKPGTPIILCHNGVGTVEELPQYVLSNHPILALLTTFGCKKASNTHRIQTGVGFSDLGLISGQLDKNKKIPITNHLDAALSPVNWSDNIKEKQWQKLAINAVINPITAINQCKNGNVNSPEFSELKAQLVTEIVQVAQSDGVTFQAETLHKTITQVAEKTAMNTSSMLADVIAKQKTEIDYINGYIVNTGKGNNISVTANERMWAQVNKLTCLFT